MTKDSATILPPLGSRQSLSVPRVNPSKNPNRNPLGLSDVWFNAQNLIAKKRVH